jgi:hypothetical protein
MVDPDEIASFQRNGIATPYVLRVELSNVNVLQDNVLSTNDAKTFALNDTR